MENTILMSPWARIVDTKIVNYESFAVDGMDTWESFLRDCDGYKIHKPWAPHDTVFSSNEKKLLFSWFSAGNQIKQVIKIETKNTIAPKSKRYD